MSSLAISRRENPELNRRIEEIKQQSQIRIKSAVIVGYRELEIQNGKCSSRMLAIFSVAFSAWCIFSSVLSAYGAVKAYDEFTDEGGFLNGGSSIGGHTAEWWPRIAGSVFTSLSWIYLLHNKGMFHHISKLYKKAVNQADESEIDNKEDIVHGLIASGVQETEEYRGKLPFFGERNRFIVHKSQEDSQIDDIELGSNLPESEEN